MVPKGWEQKKLEELCSLDAPITYGVLKPGEYFCGGIPLLQIKDLCDGSVLSNGLHLISPELDYEYRRSRIIKNDILISLVGTIGRVAKYQSSSEANIHRNIGRIRSNQHEYLFHYLRSDDVQRGITDSASGSSQSALNLSTLRSMLILVPPVIEQKKIAKILSTWDKAISVTEKLLTNSQQQKKALMQQLLTGKKRLLDEDGVRFSGEWVHGQLGDLCAFKGGFAFKEVYQGQSMGELPFIKVSDMNLLGNERNIEYSNNWVSFETAKLMKAKPFPESSIVFAKVGAALLLNRRRILLRPTIIDNNMMAAVPSNAADTEFLYQLLMAIDFARFVQEGAVPSINQGDLSSFKLSYPYVEEQQKIAAVLSAADAEISTLEKKLACLKDEKKALMQQLLSGKRRVKIDAEEAVNA
ncbi:TPA: restriction endonuclease subunit S [Escherichia coli]|uniref:restriction endonuclease subunit S n=1 Tax=Escherichia coli TaxID=562 RepID=UPI0006689999|nr:restriction endonuclease subunit S [Escherichia coli]EFE7796559.1 restriction endonuclease subunit S [Escherichia coli]PBS88475.1 restriction endonuclease subunit S [Escherichia coli]PBS96287.1 restriction endonuclease subunit S [Escherichia coli]URV00169.1 restriction endonuclease subunit S [Escherichia coli]HAW3083963.1 restriction endonuclease subunit S [Escherichia coli]